ncbi:MAG: hypothetical protein JOZ18_16010, partial [Chloroflexi bacterium]|nr:hypothetical protein [Chloroflexota bacterium]
LGIEWPFADAFLLVLVALYLLASFLLVTWLKQSRQQRAALARADGPTITMQEHKEIRP